MTGVAGERSESKTEVGQNKGGIEAISGSKEVACFPRWNMKQEVGGLFLDNRPGVCELVDRYPLWILCPLTIYFRFLFKQIHCSVL